MDILGISAFYHDSAACLVRDGRIVAAAQEERFTRKKHDQGFPAQAVAYCLKEAGIAASGLDAVVFYDKPFLKFERLLSSYLAYAPRGLSSFRTALPVWLKEKLFLRARIEQELAGYKGKVYFTEHHESHAASAFFPSPFEEAAVLTMDGVGEWATTTWGAGKGHKLHLESELRFPHSLGLLYSAFTYYTGFKVNSGEYKVMGLAPYGRPRFAKAILDNVVDLKNDGSFRLEMDYFDYAAGLRMTSEKFHRLFGGPPRQPESPLTQREMDLAASIQEVTEEIMLRMARHVRKATGQRRLCLAGGVALNCVGNGKILREKVFDELWIQPAAGDAGGALGAALHFWHHVKGNARTVTPGKDSMTGALLGPSYSDAELEGFFRSRGIPHRAIAREDVADETAKLLADGKIVGWFQGRMEFGPRALGARSLLGDPRDPKMQSKMNLKIKFRESFRPFAPAVLRERVADCFEMDADSPYMLLVAPVKESRRVPEAAEDAARFGIERLNVPRSDLPAITHVDYSARVQTVTRDANAPFYDLLKAFEARTGCPVLINTSFNVRGEPIVCRPEEAYACLMRTDMDHLVIGRFVVDKAAQPKTADDKSWMKEFALD